MSDALPALAIRRDARLDDRRSTVATGTLDGIDALEERSVRSLDGEPNPQRCIEVQRRLASLRLGLSRMLRRHLPGAVASA